MNREPDIPARIFLSKADVGKAEARAVNRAISSDWIAPLGPEVDAFEAEMADYVGCNHAVALSSGTSALHLLLLEAGASQDSVIPCSTLTFAATANAICYTGAQPYFIDSRLDGNIDPEILLFTVDTLLSQGKHVPAVVVVDLMGRCCSYTEFEGALEERGVKLIADAAESLGASCSGIKAGSHGFGSAISFNGNKIMTTSGGGMLTTNDPEVADRARYLATQARQPYPWYEHTEVGFNYRLSNVLAALGRAQLERLDSMISRRRAIRKTYENELADLGISLLGTSDAEGSQVENCWLTSVRLPEESPISPEGLISALNKANIEARHLWKPMHLQPVFKDAPATVNGTAELLFNRCVTLPSGSALGDEEIERVCASIRQAMMAS